MPESPFTVSRELLPMLVADVGGTNARFAVLYENDTSFCLQQVLRAEDFPQFIDALQAFLKGLAKKPKTACIAVAAPITGDQVSLTNRNWTFSIDALKKATDFEYLEVINDFTALAMSLPFIEPIHCRSLGSDQLQSAAHGPRVVIGPGTGLGVASLVHTGSGFKPLPGEGGHVSFAPTTALESQLLSVLTQKLGRVSYEDILSGPGLEHLYGALIDIDHIQGPPRSSPEITAAAIAGETSAVTCLDLFCGILGAYAGDLAMIASAHGGVYIGGGILPRVADFLAKSCMRQRFEQKGRMSAFVKTIPTYLITAPFPALTGAAAYLQNTYQMAQKG